MLYINDPKQPHYKYDDVVDMAIKAGVDAKRAYIYLAGQGVKGGLARVQSADSLSYMPPQKVAVRGNKLVTKVTICKSCNSLIIK